MEIFTDSPARRDDNDPLENPFVAPQSAPETPLPQKQSTDDVRAFERVNVLIGQEEHAPDPEDDLNVPNGQATQSNPSGPV